MTSWLILNAALALACAASSTWRDNRARLMALPWLMVLWPAFVFLNVWLTWHMDNARRRTLAGINRRPVAGREGTAGDMGDGPAAADGVSRAV